MTDDVTLGPDVKSALAQICDLVQELLIRNVGRRSPSRWLGELMVDYPARGGKAIRPALCIATCRAFGGTLEAALPSAAAIELLHNAFLVHDDIEDGSSLRRGRPTLHRLVGVPLALNAGDAMIVDAMSMLRQNQTLLGWRLADLVTKEFEQMLRFTVEGQAIELGRRRDGVVELAADDYVQMIVRKTGWYTAIHPLRVGAVIGGWSVTELRPLVRFGTFLAVAFQIQDDLLSLLGDPVVFGKDVLGDLYECKSTLMLAHLAKTLDPRLRATVLDPFLAAPRHERTENSARQVLALMHECGSISYARAFAEEARSAAIESFASAFATIPDSPDRALVRSLIDFIVDRDI